VPCLPACLPLKAGWVAYGHTRTHTPQPLYSSLNLEPRPAPPCPYPPHPPVPAPLPADDAHSDIPVPDHTFACYPEARYTNSSWPAIQKLLQAKSDMVAWGERHPELFHRSNWAVGPRRGLMPLLQTYANGSGGWRGFVSGWVDGWMGGCQWWVTVRGASCLSIATSPTLQRAASCRAGQACQLALIVAATHALPLPPCSRGQCHVSIWG
jgi:hypothetical protein